MSIKIFAETERLILRELLPEDAAGIFELDADPEVQRYVGNKPLTHIDQAREVITFIRRQYDENGIGRWAMTDKVTGTFIGWTGLKLIKTPVNDHINYYDLGYRLLRKHWGAGYATESAIASLKYGFEEMNLPEIFAMADMDNHGSQHVLEKVGLKHTGDIMYDGSLHKWYELQNPMMK